MTFSSPHLGQSLAQASLETLVDLPFGVVGMTQDHFVSSYNRFESLLSGMSPENVVGKNFFTEVAPCTNNFLVASRFETESSLDEIIDYVFTYRMSPTKVRLRMLKDAAAGWQFLCVEKAT